MVQIVVQYGKAKVTVKVPANLIIWVLLTLV